MLYREVVRLSCDRVAFKDARGTVPVVAAAVLWAVAAAVSAGS